MVRYLKKINDFPRLNSFKTSTEMKYNRFSFEQWSEDGKVVSSTRLIKFNILVKVRGTKNKQQDSA